MTSSELGAGRVVHPAGVDRPRIEDVRPDPEGPSSRAAEITRRSRAPFEAPYGRLPAAWSLVRARIAPPSVACRAKAAMSCQLARAFTAMCRSKDSTVVSRIAESRNSACERTRPRRGPSAAAAASTSRPGSVGTARSPGRRGTVAPRSRRSAASRSGSSASDGPRQIGVIRPPVRQGKVQPSPARRAAIPAAMPIRRPAPVMSAAGRRGNLSVEASDAVIAALRDQDPMLYEPDERQLRGDRRLVTATLDVGGERLEGCHLVEDATWLVAVDDDVHEADAVGKPERRVMEAFGPLPIELLVDRLDEGDSFSSARSGRTL